MVFRKKWHLPLRWNIFCVSQGDQRVCSNYKCFTLSVRGSTLDVRIGRPRPSIDVLKSSPSWKVIVLCYFDDGPASGTRRSMNLKLSNLAEPLLTKQDNQYKADSLIFIYLHIKHLSVCCHHECSAKHSYRAALHLFLYTLYPSHTYTTHSLRLEWQKSEQCVAVRPWILSGYEKSQRV